MTFVSVITATIPERTEMLRECVASVQSQTVNNWEHVVELDERYEGCSVAVNRAVARAKGDWLFLIADDDLMLPGCLAAHLAHVDAADVVYAPPLVWGLHDPWWFFQAPPAIPSTALIRRSLWDQLGGYDPAAVREEDRRLWTAAVELGARFVRAEGAPTWVYRLGHGGNKSFAQRAAAAA